ncbi:MAG: hypothetical protein ABI604_03935 [Nitrospirota bacterium]
MNPSSIAHSLLITLPVWRLGVLFGFAILIAVGCADVKSRGHTIYDGPAGAVRLEPVEEMFGLNSTERNAHPVALTNDQVRILLTSVSARPKVGLLRSLTGEPGTPRLFDKEHLNLLVGPIQQALAQATSREEVVFYVATMTRGTRAQITSGRLFVRKDLFYFTVSNFRHPVVAVETEVGSTDRLHDVRETTHYVHDHPTLSVGEQDFVIFFDDPRFEMEQRGIQLFGYPERTLAIAYQPFLIANADLQKREMEIHDALQQATMGKREGQAIAELKRRVAELEQTNRALAEKIEKQSTDARSFTPASVASVVPSSSAEGSQINLLEMIKHLEDRMASLETQLRQKPSKKKGK